VREHLIDGEVEELRRLFRTARLTLCRLDEHAHGELDGGFAGDLGGADKTLGRPLQGGALVVATAALVKRQISGQEHVARGQDTGALHEILEFAHVPRPVVALEHLDGFFGKLHRAVFPHLGPLLQKVLGEQPDVLDAATERRDMDADDIETVKKIFAEKMVLHLFFEALVRRGKDADIAVQRLISPHAGKLTALEDAQQLALDRERHVPDLVQEESAAIALLEATDPLVHRPGESALLVAEEFALEEIARNRGAVDRDVFRLGAA